MAQTDNPFLDGVAKAFTDAAGMAQSVRAEIDTFVRQRLERLESELHRSQATWRRWLRAASR